MRHACVVEYDGSRFRGWQQQRHGRTIQAELERALGAVADAPIALICAGRTDAGVHATGQVAHFETTAERPAHAWLMGANTHLPGDIAVRWVAPVEPSFHARYSATCRYYRYVIAEGQDRPALWRERAGWVPCRLDEHAMRTAATCLIGEHDFSAFRAAGCQARNPMRRLDAIAIARHGRWVTVDVAGNAFLHNMVRIITGTLIAVGRGDQPPEWVADVLAGRDRRRAGITAPASGLYFLGPGYPEEFGIPSPRRDDAFPP